MRPLIALLLSFCFLPAFAQTQPQRFVSTSTMGSLAGVVADPTGAVIPGATVHVERHKGTGTEFPNVVSDAQGGYTMELPPGTYDVIISAPSFEPFRTTTTVSRAGVTTKLNAALVIATEAEEVNVSSDQNSTSADANRSALVLGKDELATMSDDDSTFQQQIQALAGGDPTQPSGVYVDGFSGGQIPPKESIREIRINQNPFSAQFPELGFGRVEIFTKPGSDKLHGSFAMFSTDSVLNSQNPFSGAQPPYYFLFARGNVSGPINKKTSFFFNARYGDMGNNSVINAILPGLVNYNTVVPSPTQNSDYVVRIDRQVTANNVLTARYEFAHSRLTNGGLAGSQSNNNNGPPAAVSSQVLPSEANNSTGNVSTLQLSDTENIGKNKVLETRFQWIRNRTAQLPAVAATSGTPAYLNGGNTPTYNVSGYFNGGGSPTQQVKDHTDNIEFQEYFSLEHGKHFLRLGGRYRGTRDANMNSTGYNGTYTYAATPGTATTALENFSAGIPSLFSVTTGQQSAVVYTGDLGVYADDEYHVRKNATLNYGFRAETQSAIPDHFDPAPRVGASWAIGQTDKRQPFVTLRAGFGLFYDRFQSSNILTAVRESSGTLQPNYVFTLSGTTPTTCTISPTPACTGGSSSVSQPVIYNINPHLRSEYKIVSGLTAEKQFKFGKISVNYLHNQGDHQWISRNINAPLPGTFVYGNANSGVRPLGGTQNVYQFDSNGTATANVLFGNAQLNPTKHIQIFLFTADRFQNSDTGGATSFPTNQYNLKADYGRVASARFRIFTGAQIQLPWGFNLNPFFAMTSHNPFNITTGTDLNGDTEYNDRPSFATAASPAASVAHTALGNFNTTPVAGETIVPINYGDGPRFVYTELGLGKAFHFGPLLPPPPAPPAPPPGKPAPKPEPPARKYALNFVLEVDNLLNHPNDGQPVGQVSSPEFGKSLSLNSTFIGSPNANRMIYFGTFFNF